METPYRLIVWGHRIDFGQNVDLLHRMEENGEIEIVAVTDHRPPALGSIDGYRVIRPEEIPEYEFDYLLVVSAHQEKEIIREYLKLPGSSRAKVIPYRALHIPGVNLAQYLEIRNARISVFSRSCWGGILCWSLGMECLSPFKNLWLTDYDFLKFLKEPKKYLELVPKFRRLERGDGRTSTFLHPVLQLGDIELHCNHVYRARTAIRLWETRKKKINPDFMFAMMNTENPEIEKQFHELDGIQRKLCIVPWKSEYPFSVRYPSEKGAYQFNVIETGHYALLPVNVYSMFFGELKLRYETEELR